jgi:hypothetical protein
MGQYDRAKQILVERGDALERLAMALIDRESLGLEEVKAAIEGRPLPPIEDDAPAPSRPAEPAHAADEKEAKKKLGPGFPVAEPTA